MAFLREVSDYWENKSLLSMVVVALNMNSFDHFRIFLPLIRNWNTKVVMMINVVLFDLLT